MIKKTFFLLFALLMISRLSAQPVKGKIYLAASLGTHSNSNSSVNNFFIYALPEGGYFVTDNIMTGLGLGFSTNTTKIKNPDYTTKAPLLHITPMVKYFWRPLDKAGLFVMCYADIASGTSKTSGMGTSTSTKNSQFDFAFKSGIYIYFWKDVAFEISLSDLGVFTTKSTQAGVTTKTNTSGVLVRPGNFTISTFID